MVSARSNRVTFRVRLEPLDTFRRYAAVYAGEQALCHFSPALRSRSGGNRHGRRPEWRRT
jgi:hypothetical protein